MKKTFCDMCEKETEDSWVIKVDNGIKHSGMLTYDICEVCRLKILVILDKKDKENSNEKV